MMRLMWKKLVLCITIMTGLIVIGTRLPILTLVALAFGAFIIVQNDEQFGLSFLIFIMPMATLFKLSITSPAFFTYLELLFVVMHFLRKKLQIDTVEVSILLFGVYITVCELANGGINVNATIKMIAHLFIFYIGTQMKFDEHYRAHLYMYVFGVIISSIIANLDGFLPIKAYVLPEGYHNNGEYIGRFTGLYVDPNYYCVNVIISLCIIVLLYSRAEIGLWRLVVIAAPLFYFAIETVSKSAIIMIVMPIAFFLVTCLNRKKYGLLLLGVTMFAAVLVLALENRIPALETIMTRMLNSSKNLDSFTTHRSELWKMYFNYFMENMSRNIFGGSILYYTLNGAGAHNTYIDMIYQLGVFGSIFLVYVISTIFRNAKRFIGRTFVNYSVLLCILIMYAALGELQYFDPPYHFIMCYIVLNLPSAGERQSSNSPLVKTQISSV